MEEPILRLDPLRKNSGFTCPDIVAGLGSFPAIEYQEMAEHALSRVHRDLGTEQSDPPGATMKPSASTCSRH